MKKLSSFAALLLMGAAVTTGFTSCSDDNGDVVDTENPTIENVWKNADQREMFEIANQYVNNVVYYTYTTLANNSQTLYLKAQDIKTKYAAGTLTDADIAEACEDFAAARRYYEMSESFLFGAASDYEIDPHIDSWPLDQGQMANFMSDKAMVAGLYSDDPIAFVNKNYGNFDTALGFHGLEFVLFRDGQPRRAAAFDKLEDHSSFAGKNVQAKDELAFLVAVAGDVRDHCWEMEVAWLGQKASQEHRDRVAKLGYGTKARNGAGYYYGANYLLAGQSNISTLNSINATISTILGSKGCANICNEVAEQKLGQAWRVATGAAQEGPDNSINYIESPYSHRSFIDYRDNLYSIKNSLYGKFIEMSAPDTQISNPTPAEHSILNYLKNKNYPNYDALVSAMNAAIASLDAPINAGRTFVENPGADYVRTAIEAIGAFNTQLTTAAEWVEKN